MGEGEPASVKAIRIHSGAEDGAILMGNVGTDLKSAKIEEELTINDVGSVSNDGAIEKRERILAIIEDADLSSDGSALRVVVGARSSAEDEQREAGGGATDDDVFSTMLGGFVGATQKKAAVARSVSIGQVVRSSSDVGNGWHDSRLAVVELITANGWWKHDVDDNGFPSFQSEWLQNDEGKELTPILGLGSNWS
ncbi:hypothetical protein PIB30_020422 [Stylosanthes scabra]|uniref:Uncharacterized protein n=1 Tax=Stylosanthes scabra TaxID=79078 RepID=A0ABU6S7Z8_9FABA|nr:hypothetical protein [Stylosanthes scabra]